MKTQTKPQAQEQGSTIKTWSSLPFWGSEEWEHLKGVINGEGVTPSKELIFRPLMETPLSRVKVVILGREPYNGIRHIPDGLAFSASLQQGSVSDLPEPLLNLYKEAIDDVGIREPKHGNLKKWAKQGVLLWNTIPTTLIGRPLSHLHDGWHVLTHNIISAVAEQNPDAVFVAWTPVPGLAYIPEGCRSITGPGPTPSQAAMFRGSKPFSKINHTLRETGQTVIDWNVS